MKRKNLTNLLRCGAAVGIFSLIAVSGRASAAEDAAVITVSSKVSDDYVRGKLPSGEFEPEAYAFAEGGVWNGTVKDASADKIKFMDVARTVARPLLAQNYIAAKDPAKTKLMIMVYWGTTTGPESASDSAGYHALQASQKAGGSEMRDLSKELDKKVSTQQFDDAALALTMLQNRLRDRDNMANARILGYDTAMSDVQGWSFGPMRAKWNDMVYEVEENRYFIVLMAYDFQLLAKEKKAKVLWETRFSITQKGNQFDQRLAAMAQSASHYFGQKTPGLLRKPIGTDVKLHDMQVIGVVPES